MNACCLREGMILPAAHAPGQAQLVADEWPLRKGGTRSVCRPIGFRNVPPVGSAPKRAAAFMTVSRLLITSVRAPYTEVPAIDWLKIGHKRVVIDCPGDSAGLDSFPNRR